MTSFDLRLLAVITMLIDHTAHVLLPVSSPFYMPMRIIGRLAFPIFCFLLVEGAFYTRSRKKYLWRMAASAFISVIPFDMAMNSPPRLLDVIKMGFSSSAGQTPFNKELLSSWFKSSHQNVFFTLTLGLTAIIAAEFLGGLIPRIFPAWQELQIKYDRFLRWNFWKAVLAAPVVAACCFAADWIRSDFGWSGVIMVALAYAFRPPAPETSPPPDRITRASSPAALAVWNIFRYFGTPQSFAAFAAVPLFFYNREPGPKKLKWGFYLFYPAHLLILALIRGLG